MDLNEKASDQEHWGIANTFTDIALQYATKGNYFCLGGRLDHLKEAYLRNGRRPSDRYLNSLFADLYNDIIGLDYILGYGQVEPEKTIYRIPTSGSELVYSIEEFRKAVFEGKEHVDLNTVKDYYYSETDSNIKKLISKRDKLPADIDYLVTYLLDLIVGLDARYKVCGDVWSRLVGGKGFINRLITTLPLVNRRDRMGNFNMSVPDITYIRDAKSHNAYLVEGQMVRLLLNRKLSYEKDVDVTVPQLYEIYNNASRKIHLFQLVLILQQVCGALTGNICKK